MAFYYVGSLAVAWLTWSERNRRVFEDRSSNPIDIMEFTCFLVGLWAKALRIFVASDCFLFSLNCVNFVG